MQMRCVGVRAPLRRIQNANVYQKPMACESRPCRTESIVLSANIKTLIKRPHREPPAKLRGPQFILMRMGARLFRERDAVK